MKQIKSFTIDHTKLKPGLYLSREDRIGKSEELVQTYDLRVKEPNNNHNDYLSPVQMHSIEHYVATYLRDPEECNLSSDIIYFGPMGCRTGFYLVISGDHRVTEIKEIICSALKKLISEDNHNKLPGESKVECGHYKELSMIEARVIAHHYLNVLKDLNEEDMTYPD